MSGSITLGARARRRPRRRRRPRLGHRHRRPHLPRRAPVPAAAAAGGVPRPAGRRPPPPAGPGRALAGEEAAAGLEMPAGGPGSARASSRDLAAGWREFTSHTWLWVMVAGVSLFLFAIEGPIQVLGPIVAARRLRRRPHLGLHLGSHGHRADRRRPAQSALAAAPPDAGDRRRHESRGSARGAPRHGSAGLDALRLAGRDGRGVGTVRPVLDDVHAAGRRAGHDLPRVELRLPRLAGVLPGGAGVGRTPRRRLRHHDGALDQRRRGHPGQRLPALLARRARSRRTWVRERPARGARRRVSTTVDTTAFPCDARTP